MGKDACYTGLLPSIPAVSSENVWAMPFNPAVNYAAGVRPRSVVAVGDFDGDGNLDLAVANADSTDVSILLGNGDGTFTVPALTYAGGDEPNSIAVGSFNGAAILT
ncbi:MAG: hypothetical protein A2Z77_03575 [Chloroflexi bacterium RBG_13_51_36]|nr:MAG: hypothetical protein A2Z77_03575 [Chloroflexi bacterium RBG_13_51_36]